MISTEEWAQWSALLDQALELDPAAREAWLADLQARDPAAAAGVARLLAHGVETAGPDRLRDYESGLRSVLAAPQDGAATVVPEQRFGHWQVSRQIGVGGMGEVWLAQRADGQDEGLAAIKLLKSGADASRLINRFGRERRVLARLNHPGIARLLDAGVEGTQPYLVLEYVKGRPLPQYLAAEHPDVAARVRLAIAIGEAVEYAHGQLIVHRDLKPSNVMVADDGTAKLLDFGIAGLLGDDDTDTTALTQLYGRGLTLDYAAPEQITGEPTGVACDVFSLGVMLFEMLTGQRPFQASEPGRAALEHAILHTDALRVGKALSLPQSTLTAARPDDAERAKGDLESILAKALRRHPEDRYPTIAALLADLRGWLESRPVSAGRDDLSYRTRLWLRRNRSVAALTLAVLVSLSVGLGMALWQRNQAQAAHAQADRARESSDDVVRFFSEDMIGDLRVGTQNLRDPTVREMFAVSEQNLDERFQDAPLSKARVQAALATGYFYLPDFAAYQRNHEAALQAARAAGPGDFEAAFDIVSLLMRTGWTNFAKSSEVPVFEQMLRTATARWGAQDERVKYFAVDVANAYAATGDWPAALRIQRPILETYRAQQPPPIGLLIGANRLVGNNVARAGDPQAALAYYAEAKAAADQIPAGQNDVPVGLIEAARSRTLLDLGRTDEAVTLARDALEKLARTNPEASPSVTAAHSLLGAVLIAQGHPAEALEETRKALAGLALFVPPWAPQIAYVQVNEAEALVATGKAAQAWPLFEEAVKQTEVLSPDHPSLVAYRSQWAEALAMQGQVDRARAVLDAIPAAALAKLPPTHLNLAIWQRARCAVLSKQGDSAAAGEACQAAIAGFKHYGGEQDARAAAVETVGQE